MRVRFFQREDFIEDSDDDLSDASNISALNPDPAPKGKGKGKGKGKATRHKHLPGTKGKRSLRSNRRDPTPAIENNNEEDDEPEDAPPRKKARTSGKSTVLHPSSVAPAPSSEATPASKPREDSDKLPAEPEKDDAASQFDEDDDEVVSPSSKRKNHRPRPTATPAAPKDKDGNVVMGKGGKPAPLLFEADENGKMLIPFVPEGEYPTDGNVSSHNWNTPTPEPDVANGSSAAQTSKEGIG